MPEHRIRLRAAWERLDPDSPSPRRVDLPIIWSADELSGPFTLRRGFGGPASTLGLLPHDLEIAEAPGVVAVRLNGQALKFQGEDPIRVLVTDELQRRNVVEIDVDGPVAWSAGPGTPWGEVALIILED